ncbi:MAG: GtrA family protein [Acholeplasmataceae bacterium]
MTRKENFIQFAKFLGFSISAGAIQLVSFTLMFEIVKLPYWPSYLTALTLSVLWNFTFNRRFTFKSANNVPVAMTKIFIFYLIFTPLSTWWGDAFTKLGVNAYIVLGGTMIINFVTEFLYSRVFIYKNQMNTRIPNQNKTI